MLSEGSGQDVEVDAQDGEAFEPTINLSNEVVAIGSPNAEAVEPITSDDAPKSPQPKRAWDVGKAGRDCLTHAEPVERTVRVTKWLGVGGGDAV